MDMEIKKQEKRDAKKDADMPKTVKLVSSMCEMLRNSGCVVNMDNLYSSPEVFIELRRMGIYARGTVRTNRKYLPKFIQFSKTDVKNMARGSYRFATNDQYQISCYAWNDKNPVHLLSTADSTDVQFTKRQTKSEKINVVCPVAIKEYNAGMQGVDQFNRLITLFSMSNLHFDKYYKKVAMILMDLAVTNAYLHYKMDNASLPLKYTRCTFMERLQNQMITVNWSRKVRQLNTNDKINRNNEDGSADVGSVDDILDKELEIGDYAIQQKTQSKENVVIDKCFPVALHNKNDDKTPDSQRACQICEFEGRGRKVKFTNYCTNHKVKCCTITYPSQKIENTFIKWGEKYDNSKVRNWEWLCPETELTCWQKAHKWYIPNGLFNLSKGNSKHPPQIDYSNIFKVNQNSDLALKRHQALLGCGYKKDRTKSPEKK